MEISADTVHKLTNICNKLFDILHFASFSDGVVPNTRAERCIDKIVEELKKEFKEIIK